MLCARPSEGCASLRCAWWATLLIGLALSGATSSARAVTGGPVITIHTDELAGPPSMGLGVEWDPYDTFQPTQADWNRVFQRLDYMRPGFIRVVAPAYDYFGGYDQNNNPVYRWTSDRVLQLRTILDYAQSRGITVVLGDWSNPMINGDRAHPCLLPRSAPLHLWLHEHQVLQPVQRTQQRHWL